MVINTNISAFNSNRQLGLVTGALSKSTEKLSSGYRINRSADDAAGLAISEKMRRQIRGLSQATSNATDGISFCQIADGALNEVHEMMKRCEELTIQAANGTNTDDDRSYIQTEINQLTQEIDRVHTTSTFNERRVFPDTGLNPSYASLQNPVSQASEAPNLTIEWSFVDNAGNKVALADVQATGTENDYATSDMAQFIVHAASDAVSGLRAAYPNLFAAASSDGIEVGLKIANLDGPGGMAASARLELAGSSTSTVMSYTLNVDSSDYAISDFTSMTDAEKADLAAVIAHEMTHLVMYDTLSGDMAAGRYPGWFVEGMAQTSSGDNDWVTYSFPSMASLTNDYSIGAFMANLYANSYGTGYMATMTLGHLVSGEATVSSDSIKRGLDILMTDMAKNQISLDEAIRNHTGYSGTTDYQNKYQSADSTLLNVTKDILSLRGLTGAGSLLAPSLSTTEAAAFAPATLTGVGGNYVVDPNNTRHSNAFGTGYSLPAPGSVDDSDSGFNLQVGVENGQIISVNQFNMSASSIFNGLTLDVTSPDSIGSTLAAIKIADANVSAVRAYYGALQNRLEHTINNLNNVVENTTASESQIRDTDMATEMVKFSNRNILLQAGQSMLAQSNQSNQGVLALLQ